MKVSRVAFTDDEWKEVTPFITHYGDISFLIRQATLTHVRKLKAEMEMENVRSENGEGRGVIKTKTYINRGGSR